jgi:hypothetical protein
MPLASVLGFGTSLYLIKEQLYYPHSDTYMNMYSHTRVYGRVMNLFPLSLATANPRFYMCKFGGSSKVTL